MKNLIIGDLCAALIIPVGIRTYEVKNVKASASLNSSSTKPNKELSSKQIPNPMKEYSTLDEARKAAGFNFVIPTVLPDGYQMNGIKVINGACLCPLPKLLMKKQFQQWLKVLNN